MDVIYTETNSEETTIRHMDSRVILRQGERLSQFQVLGEDGEWHTVHSSPDTDALMGMVDGFSGDVLQIRTKLEDHGPGKLTSPSTGAC